MLTAVVTGVEGQDGSFLTEFLLAKKYKVIGISRRKSSSSDPRNVDHLLGHENFRLIRGDICDATFISRIVYEHKPHEWYNLAAMSHVGQSFQEPTKTFEVNAQAVIGQLDAIREFSPSTRFYQASTSELWGGLTCPKEGYKEGMSFHPRSPYGVSKLSAYWAVVNYREAYNLHASNGILHNHSSTRRGLDFATRKITRGVAKVKLGVEDKVKMGNLSAFRDEGHAKDYVEAMWLMLQQDNSDDYIIATGSGATIEDMFRYVCELADIDFEDTYEQDPRFMRPSEVPYLLGDYEKARKVLDWKPKYTWKKLLAEMYEFDLKELQRELR